MNLEPQDVSAWARLLKLCIVAGQVRIMAHEVESARNR
jgi:hypothetical protein